MSSYEEFCDIKPPDYEDVVASAQYTRIMKQDGDTGIYEKIDLSTPHRQSAVEPTGVKPSAVPNTKLLVLIATTSVVVLAVVVIILATMLTGKSNDDDLQPTIPPIIPGEWSNWTEWGDCSVTCDAGLQTRIRICESGDCHGLNAQSRICWEQNCPWEVDAYGKWTTWSAWTACGQTCGPSTQSRSRNCIKEADQKYCHGEATRSRKCDEGSCPDCSKVCTNGGTLESECVHCVCSNINGTGRVLTERGEPMQDVQVSDVNFAYSTLAHTSVSGIYTLEGACLGTHLSFRHKGFISATVIYQTPMEDVNLNRIVPMTITQEPDDTARLVGECLMLQCKADGTPEPDFYEWYRNGILLEPHSSNMLHIKNIKIENSGYYQCRASNDFSAVFSRNVLIDVKENPEDFCYDSPLSLVKTLPSGCTHDGKSTIDVGMCMHAPCSYGNELCAEKPKSTCGAIEYDTVNVQCAVSDVIMSVVKSCGCVPWKKPEYKIHGVVVSDETGDPVPLAKIIVGGNETTTSLYGNFHIEGEVNTTRIAINIEDPFSGHAQQIVVLDIQDESAREQYVRITMRKHPNAINITSSEESSFQIGTSILREEFGLVTIQPNSLYRTDGEPFTGTVKAIIDIYDARSVERVDTAPGDFSAINEEGDDVMLISTGMFRLSMKDTDGADLNLAGKVNISFNTRLDDINAAYGSKSQIRLWSLSSSSGKWEILSEMRLTNVYHKDVAKRKKRRVEQQWGQYSVELDGIDINRRWTNFDFISTGTCHSKIRVYKDNNFEPNKQLAGANINILTLAKNNPSTPGNTVSSGRAYSDANDDSNGYCIVHPCDSPRSNGHYDYKGYIIAVIDGTPLMPSISEPTFPIGLNYTTSGKAIKSNFNLKVVQDGPLYDWDTSRKWRYSDKCSNVNQEAGHYRFYRSDKNSCTALSINRKNQVEGGPNKENWYAWKPNIDSGGYMYIKMLVDWDIQISVTAQSVVGVIHDNKVKMKVGDWYGTREDCTENRIVCLEVKASGVVWNGGTEFSNEVLTAIDFDLHNVSTKYKVSRNDQLAAFASDITISDTGTSSYMIIRDEQNNNYGQSYGIYYSVDSLKGAEYACRRGTDDKTISPDPPPMTRDNWAFKFEPIL